VGLRLLDFQYGNAPHCTKTPDLDIPMDGREHSYLELHVAN